MALNPKAQVGTEWIRSGVLLKAGLHNTDGSLVPKLVMLVQKSLAEREIRLYRNFFLLCQSLFNFLLQSTETTGLGLVCQADTLFSLQ